MNWSAGATRHTCAMRPVRYTKGLPIRSPCPYGTRASCAHGAKPVAETSPQARGRCLTIRLAQSRMHAEASCEGGVGWGAGRVHARTGRALGRGG